MDVCQNMCLSIIFMQSMLRPEGHIISPGVELQKVVNHHVNSGDQTQVLSEKSRCTLDTCLDSSPFHLTFSRFFLFKNLVIFTYVQACFA